MDQSHKSDLWRLRHVFGAFGKLANWLDMFAWLWSEIFGTWVDLVVL